MIVSMTGYGRAMKEQLNYKVTVEIKSVNHRFSEINLRMPRQLLVIEDKIKKAVREHIRRGRVELFITIEGAQLIKRKLQIDWDLMDHFYHLLEKAKIRYEINEEITLHQLFSLAEIVGITEEETDSSFIENVIFETIHTALTELIEMRQQEGAELYKEISTYLAKMNDYIDKILACAPLVVQQYRERIAGRLNEYTDGMVDEQRLLTETVLFAEKADISEEITRLNSHILQFKQSLASGEEVGRKLDFLVQEMNREINTIGSKANNHSIAKYVVELKSLLEKMKEQVQNIE